MLSLVVLVVLECIGRVDRAVSADLPPLQVQQRQTQPQLLVVNASAAVHVVDAREVSFTWDIYALAPGPMNKSSPFNLTDPIIRALTAELQPLIIRISGTGCENAEFDDGGGSASSSFVPIPRAVNSSLRPGGGGTSVFNTSASDWTRVAEFIRAVDADVVCFVYFCSSPYLC